LLLDRCHRARGTEMAKKATKRPWTQEDVRTLKALAREKTKTSLTTFAGRLETGQSPPAAWHVAGSPVSYQGNQTPSSLPFGDAKFACPECALNSIADLPTAVSLIRSSYRPISPCVGQTSMSADSGCVLPAGSTRCFLHCGHVRTFDFVSLVISTPVALALRRNHSTRATARQKVNPAFRPGWPRSPVCAPGPCESGVLFRFVLNMITGSNRFLPKRNRSHGPPFLNFGY